MIINILFPKIHGHDLEANWDIICRVVDFDSVKCTFGINVAGHHNLNMQIL